MQIHPLRRWRKHNEIKLEALAEMVGITASHLSMIECGLRNPSLGVAAKLSAITKNKVRLAEFVNQPAPAE